MERDTDGDGWFTARDRSRIDTRGAGTTMYIHRGGPLDGDQANSWSAGCQTIPGPLYPQFLEAVGHPSSFFYVLVDTVRA